MDSQFTDDQLKAQFLTMLSGFDAIEEGKSHPKFRLSERYLRPALSWSRERWIDWYETEPTELVRELALDCLSIIGVGKDDLKGEPNEIVEMMTDKLRQLARINVDPETVLDLLSDRLAVVIVKYRCLLVMLVSQLRFKTPLHETIELAKKGSSQATLDLVKLDHTFLSASYVTRQIRAAELTGDHAYFGLLSSALKPDPAFWRLKRKRRYFALWTLSQVGDFAYRSDQEWSDFLEPLGFPSWEDSEVVRKARENYGFSVKKR